MKHKAISDGAVPPIKGKVKAKVIEIKTGIIAGDDDANAMNARNKKIKFLNFILNLHQKHAFRTWKQNVFGTGGDPRLGLLLVEERDKLRREFFHPQIERRKNLKFLKKILI